MKRLMKVTIRKSRSKKVPLAERRWCMYCNGVRVAVLKERLWFDTDSCFRNYRFIFMIQGDPAGLWHYAPSIKTAKRLLKIVITSREQFGHIQEETENEKS